MHIADQQELHALLGGAALLGVAKRFLNSLKGFLQKALCQRASDLSSFREVAKIAGSAVRSPRSPGEHREVNEVAGRAPGGRQGAGSAGGSQGRRESAKVPGARREVNDVAKVAGSAASAGRTASGNGNADAAANENAAEAKQKPRRGHPQQGLLSFVLLLYD